MLRCMAARRVVNLFGGLGGGAALWEDAVVVTGFWDAWL